MSTTVADNLKISQDIRELECPVTFNEYGVTAYDTPVTICSVGHTASLGAVAEVMRPTPQKCSCHSTCPCP